MPASLWGDPQYDSGARRPARNLINAVPRRALLKGFIILDHMDWLPRRRRRWGPGCRGRLVAHPRARGLDSGTECALKDLFTGANIGKTLVRL